MQSTEFRKTAPSAFAGLPPKQGFVETSRRDMKEKLVPNPKLRLREQVGEVMRFHHYSIRTEESYWQWIKRFIFFHGKRHPKEMGAAEVSAFLSHLTVADDAARATQQ